MTSAPQPTSGYDSYWDCLTWQEYYQSCFSTCWDCFSCKVLLVLCSHLSSTHEVSQALAGYLALRALQVLRCQGPRRQSPGRSAAPVIPTKTKSVSTTATWISSGSTLLNAPFPTECRATEDLSGSDEPPLAERRSTRWRRPSGASVPCLTPTASATPSVTQVPCRRCH